MEFRYGSGVLCARSRSRGRLRLLRLFLALRPVGEAPRPGSRSPVGLAQSPAGGRPAQAAAVQAAQQSARAAAEERHRRARACYYRPATYRSLGAGPEATRLV